MRDGCLTNKRFRITGEREMWCVSVTLRLIVYNEATSNDTATDIIKKCVFEVNLAEFTPGQTVQILVWL